MSKLEAWKAWNKTVAIYIHETEYSLKNSLEKSSHGKAFSYAWDAAVEAEREACAKTCEEEQFELTEDVSGKNGLQHFDAGCRSCAEMIRKRGEI